MRPIYVHFCYEYCKFKQTSLLLPLLCYRCYGNRYGNSYVHTKSKILFLPNFVTVHSPDNLYLTKMLLTASRMSELVIVDEKKGSCFD